MSKACLTFALLLSGCAAHHRHVVRVHQSRQHCEDRMMGGIVVQVICPPGYFGHKP